MSYDDPILRELGGCFKAEEPGRRERAGAWACAIAMLLLCMGCATNNYEKFYFDTPGEREVKSVHGDAPVILKTVKTQDDVIGLIEEGYVWSGISSFDGPYTPPSYAVDTAEKHGAALVLLDVRPRETNQHASVMYTPFYSTGTGISPTDALPLIYRQHLQSQYDREKKEAELAERKYEADRRARFSRKGRFLWMTTYSLDEEAAKYPDEESDPHYYNILVGGANAAGEGFTALSALPFGVFAKGDNKELFRNGEVQEIRNAIERAAKRGKNVRVFGHSWGGATVARLAPEYPDIPFYALDPVSWTGIPDEIPKNLTIYHPRGNDDFDYPRLAQILGRQWPVITKGEGKTVFYDGDHFLGLRPEMNALNQRVRNERTAAETNAQSVVQTTACGSLKTAKRNAAPVHGNVDVYDHDAMFFKKIDASNVYGVYWDVPKRLLTEKEEAPIKVRILAVLHGSQAEKDGIKRGQIVKAINGNAIKTRADVIPYVNKKERIMKMEVEDGAQ